VILQSLVKFLVFLWTVVYIALAPGMIRDDELAKLANSIDTAVSPAGPWN